MNSFQGHLLRIFRPATRETARKTAASSKIHSVPSIGNPSDS